MTTQLPNGYEAVKVLDEEWVKYINYYWVGKSNNEFWLCATAGQLDIDIQKLDQSYAILGRADELTKEECRGVVEGFYSTFAHAHKYMDYQDQNHFYRTALESFRSLLASLHLEPHTTIILKKENV